jgi:hypothetical protein
MGTAMSNRSGPSVLHAVLSVIALLLAFGALHDIADGTEADLFLEYTVLGTCFAWFVFVASTLLRRSRRLLGTVALIAVGAAAWSQGIFYTASTRASEVPRLVTATAFVSLVIVTLALFALLDEARHSEAHSDGAKS